MPLYHIGLSYIEIPKYFTRNLIKQFVDAVGRVEPGSYLPGTPTDPDTIPMRELWYGEVRCIRAA
jgi:hypothetical protein